MYEPQERPEAPADPTLLLRGNKNYLRFILYCGAMSFSVNIAGAFLPIYMLRDLRFNYVTYTGLILAAQAMMYWMMGRWGRSADRAGNMKVVQVTARLLPLTSLFWVFSCHPTYLFAVQLVSGVIWAGYNLCSANFVFDAVPNNQRLHASALFNTVTGLAVFAGASLGGLLLAILPPIGGNSFYSLLILSSAARFVTGWFLFPRLREVRPVPATNNRELVYSLIGLEPA